MRILHLLSQTELTGAEVYAGELIKMQMADHHDVFVISEKWHIQTSAQVTQLSTATKSFIQRIRNILVLRQFLKKEKIQVIHCHSRGAVRHAYWARIFLPIGMTTTLHGVQHFSWSKKIMNIYGELLIAVCENIKLSMTQNFGVPPSSIKLLRNPVQIFSEAMKTEEADKNDPKLNRKKLLIAGRSTGPKGENIIHLTRTYFADWLRKDPELEITLVASGAEKWPVEFQSYLAQLGYLFPKRFQSFGTIPQLSQELTKYSLVIGSGRVAIECLLSKTPVLALGEIGYHGLVTKENYPECVSSNFGDIHFHKASAKIDFDLISQDVLKFFQNQNDRSEHSIQLGHLKDISERDFSPHHIHKNVIEVYKGALFKRQFPHWIPILMYHKIPDQVLQTQHRIFVIKEKFSQHLKFFRFRKMQTMTFDELLTFWDLEKPMSQFPKRPLVLTFDDGYLDNLTNAQPLLLNYNMKAQIFLLADHNLTKNTWDIGEDETSSRIMNLNERKQLNPKAFRIGSHGFQHLHLTEYKNIALKEMANSKSNLQNEFQQNVVVFAYPYGSSDLELARICFEAGYRFAVNTDKGGLHLADDPHSIFRVNVFPEESIFSLWKKTSRFYRKYYFKKRGQ